MTQTQSQDPAQGKKDAFGVSFLTICLVLVTITVLASVGIPVWFSQPRISLQKAADLLVQDIGNVQDHSVYGRKSCRIDFDTDGGGYSAVTRLGEALEAPMGNGPYIRDYDADAVFDGIIIDRVDFGGKRSLTFDRTGNPIANGAVWLSYNGETRKVVFDAGIAYVVGKNER